MTHLLVSGWEGTGRFVRMLFQIAIGIKDFLAVLLVIVLGFSVAFHLLFRTEAITDANRDYMGWETLVQVYTMMLGGGEPDQFRDAGTVWLAYVFYVVYTGFATVLLLNLLIGKDILLSTCVVAYWG